MDEILIEEKMTINHLENFLLEKMELFSKVAKIKISAEVDTAALQMMVALSKTYPLMELELVNEKAIFLARRLGIEKQFKVKNGK